MYPYLTEIADRVGERPRWWGKGIPHDCDFDPREARYGRTVLLVRIGCQACGRPFDTAIGTDAPLSEKLIDSTTGRPIESAWDDPPHHLGKSGYSCVGNSMLADWIAVLEVWEESGADWVRRPDLEGELPDIWPPIPTE